MAERVVSIKLIADATGLTQGFNRASDAAQKLREDARGAGQSLADSARNNREAWATVGTGLTAVGVAITGVGVAALKTGIQYNTMQQTTRAALTTLLGSAQAANAQMDKLDAFARNSPFSKATFITAQQQMLAFGIETKKVIPYLDAVQNAVAAAGGNNQQIGELAFIMAQISAAGKITAQDLMQFGQRGVNAAKLIGSQMGKTGAQIRQDISSGALDANAALDALAAGMQQTYAGAAANVKNTFEGAMDRVKAAWRDFSAELAKPLVDPNGGGALVELLNWTADAMRNFQKLPEPIRDTTVGIAGLAGAGTLAAGSFMLLFPKVLELNAHLKTLGVTAGIVGKSFGVAGIVLAAGMAAAALSDWSAKTAGTLKTADGLTRALKGNESAIKAVNEALASNSLQRFFDVDNAAVDNLKAMNTTFGDLQSKFEGTAFGKATTFINTLGTGGQLGKARQNIEELDSAMASLVASGDTESAARAYEQFAAKAEAAGWSTDRIASALPKYKEAVAGAIPPTETSADRAADAAAAYTDQANAAKAATDELLGLVNALLESNSIAQAAEGANARYQKTLADVADYVAKAQEGVEGYSRSIDENTVEGSKNREMLAGLAADSQSAAEKLLEQETATIGAEQATANFQARLGEGRQALYNTILGLTGSSEAAQVLTDKLYAIPTPEEIKVMVETATATRNLDTFMGRLNSIPSVVRTEIRTVQSFVYKDPGSLYQGGSMGGTVGSLPYGPIGFANGGTVPGIGGYVAGGTVYGRGTSKSDSILTRLSKGEEVIQEPYASLNRPILKAINRGDFHPGMVQPQVVATGGPVEVSLAGAVLQAELEGAPVTLIVRRQITSALSSASSGALVSSMGVRRR